jgi:O-antigen/teichoic acid export membrane protein
MIASESEQLDSRSMELDAHGPEDGAVSGALRNGLLYAMSNALARGASILLLPVLTRQLTDQELGVYAVLAAVLLLMQYLSSGGLDTAATRWFFEFREQQDRDATIATWVASQLIASTAVAAVIAVAARPLSTIVFRSASFATPIRAAALALPLTVATLIVQHWFRIHEKATAAVVFGVGTAVLTVGCTIGCVGPLGLGLSGVFLGQAVAGVVLTICGIAAVNGKVHLGAFSKVRLVAMLRYSLPVLPSVAAIYLLAVLTRLLINGLSSTEVVGDYQVVAMLATGAALFTQAVQQAWEPFALGANDREASRPIYRTALVGYFVVATVLCSAIAVVGPWALQLVGLRYRSFGAELVVMCAAILVAGAMPIVNTGAAIVGSGRPALLVMCLSILANVGLAFALIPKWGLAGAVWASLIAAIVTVPVHVWLVESLWPIGVQVSRLAGVLVVGSVGIGLVTSISTTELRPFLLGLAATVLIASTAAAALRRLVAEVQAASASASAAA